MMGALGWTLLAIAATAVVVGGGLWFYFNFYMGNKIEQVIKGE